MQDYRPVLLVAFALLSLLASPALADRIFTLCETNSGYTAPNQALLRTIVLYHRPRGLTSGSKQRCLESRPSRHAMHDCICAHSGPNTN
jgi:hypothetical protein